MQWIDMALFNEKKKYKTHSTFRCIIIGILCVCVFTVGSVIYYCNTTHYIYEEFSHAQATHVTGLENILLNVGIIQTPGYYGDDFSPYWDTYTNYGSVDVLFTICLASILFLLLSSLFHSPLIKKIYNIQNGNKSQKYRAIQNKQGKMGYAKLDGSKSRRFCPLIIMTYL